MWVCSTQDWGAFAYVQVFRVVDTLLVELLKTGRMPSGSLRRYSARSAAPLLGDS